MQKTSLYLEARLLTSELSVCRNFYERARGLLWRKPLDAATGEALLIPHCNSVHTAFMAYTIDVIFVDRQGKITSIKRALAPWRAAVDLRASLVVECPEGASWTQDLVVGQVLRWD